MQLQSTNENEKGEIFCSAISVDTPICNLFESSAVFNILSDFPENDPHHQSGLFFVSEHLELSSPSPSFQLNLQKCKIVVLVSVRNGAVSLELHQRGRGRLQYQGEYLASTVAHIARNIPTNHEGMVREIELVNMGAILKWRNEYNKQYLEPCQQTFVEFLHQQCSRNPEALAICAWDGELTYGQLDTAIDHAAGNLRQQGVRRGALVPICFEKSLYAIVSELAILKAGGAFVPIDPAQPENRLRQTLEQVNATVIVTSITLMQRMSNFGLPVITCCKESISKNISSGMNHCPETSLSISNTAYVVFSSGSTGRSTGCVMTHSALADVVNQSRALHLAPDSRVLQFASYSFAVSVVQIFCTLAAGATVYVPSEEDCRNRLADYMHEMSINWALLTPSTLNVIQGPSLVPSLKTLILAGEPMGRHLVQSWADHVDLYELYGLSEWTGFVAVSPRIMANSAIANSAHSTGLSSPTATMWLADPMDHNRLMPVGSVAELMLEGPGLAQGYLGDPVKTAQKFIDSPPWILGHKRRVYKTGDLVQYLPNGSIRYIARKDLQVKIRGIRLELTDLEHYISQQCPSVKRAVVGAVAPGGSSAAPVLAVFLHYPDNPTVEEKENEEGPLLEAQSSWRLQFQIDVSRLKTELPKSLPQHMIPAIYLPLRQLPLTITGKVDRRRIRDTISNTSWVQLQTYALQKVEQVAPNTENEIVLHDLFARVLEIQPQTFGVHDSFLRYGGDSLKAMRLAHLCRQNGLFSITFREIMEYQTIRQLASMHKDDRSEEKSLLLCKLTSAIKPDFHLKQIIVKRLRMFGLPEDTTVEGVFPCSHVQEGILVSQARNTSHYQMRLTYDITPAAHNDRHIDVSSLKRAWTHLVRIHPILRTLFVESTVPGLLALQVVLGQTICETSIMQCQSTTCEYLPGTGDDFVAPELMWSSLPRLTVKNYADGRCTGVLSISHAITDATSLSIMIQDLKRLYSLGVEGGGNTLPKRLLYSDYLTCLKQDSQSSPLDYWTSYLADAEPCLFPILNAHHHQVCDAPRWQRLPIQLEEASRYYQFCSITGVTLASIVKLAWGMTLRSFKASNKVCFGYVTSGRDLALDGIENAVGPYINNLPCALDINSDKPIIQILHELQADFAKSLPYQRVSLAAVLHSLGLSGESALFNSSVTFLPQLLEEENSEIQITEVERWDPTENDILVEITNLDRKICAELKYWSRVLSELQARNVANTMSRILSQIISTPQKKPCEIQLISFEDEAQIHQLNSTLSSPNDACVDALIYRQCGINPTAEAICSWDGTVSYGKLQELSTAMALELSNRGVKRGTYVPLCLSRSYWTPVAMLAVIKTGAAFCLLDITHPRQRLRQICDLLRTSVIITSAEHHGIAEQLGGNEIFCVDRKMLVSPNKAHCLGIPSSSNPSDALFIVFTSGSTGKPKGIIIEHRSYTTNAFEHARLLGLSNKSRMLQICGYAFDATVLEHLTVLLVGGCICIPSESERFHHPAEVAARMKVDTILTTPSVSRVLSPDKLPYLKTLALCGEPMDQTDIDRWTPTVRLANVYGPAECTVVSTIQPSQRGKHPRNIGWPIAFSAWITKPDDPRQLLPVGAIGELLIEGPIVGRGYIDDADQSAINFIEAPSWLQNFRGKSHRAEKCRLYRTGDLVRYDTNDFSLQYVGRIDTQVKLRGQRIELSEVERHVRSHLPCAREVIVEMVRREQSALLVAFIMTETALEPKSANYHTSSVFAHPSEPFRRDSARAVYRLQQDLPSYMIPAAWIALSELPSTRTGKADRCRLIQQAELLSNDTFQKFNGVGFGAKISPSTDREFQLQQIWASTLCIPSEQVGVEDRFFAIGGDSLSAIQAVARCRSAGLHVSAADMMQNPTIAGLAPRVETIALGEQTEPTTAPFALVDGNCGRNVILESVERLCGVEPREVEDAYPCTSLQEGLIALTARTKTAYVAEWKFNLPVEINLARLEAAWKATVAANPILRTRIIQLPDEARCYQVVIREEGPWVVYHDAEAYNSSTRQELGLNKPLVQAVVIVEESKSSLILRLHHSVYDGWSLPLLLEQVQRAYDGEELASCSMKPFIKYVQRQHQRAAQWWGAQLADLTTTVFPPLPNPDYQPTPDSTVARTMQIVQIAHDDFSLATKLCLACAMVISQYTGSNDVVFGITNSGRAAPIPGIDKLTGPTNATVPQRTSLGPRQTVRDILQQVQDDNVRVVPYEQFGLQNIAQCGDSHAAACGFQTLLVIQPPRKEYRVPLFRDEVSMTDLSAFTGYLLMLECQPSGDVVDIRASFDSKAVSKTRISEILRQFDHILGQINRPEALNTQLADLDLIHPDDVAQLAVWNSSEGDLLSECCVHDAIQEHCNKQPDAPAVCAWDGNFTYRVLDQLSGELAEYLCCCGVRPETVVPIYSDKSRWVTVAILGVIRAGGAFVLLEPSYPFERLQQICQQANAHVIVASQEYTQNASDLAKDGTVITVGDGNSLHRSNQQPQKDGNPLVPENVSPRNLLYVVFTSGSTGQPKGAMIEHRSCYMSAKGLHKRFGMGKHSRTLQFSSHAFDISVWDHIGTLMVGGCVCIPSESQRKNNLSEVMSEMQVNIAILTPSVARTLGGPNIVPKLQTLVLAGELMSQDDVSTWSPRLRLINGYGPAECAGITTVHRIHGAHDDPRNVGRPNDGFSIWITHPEDSGRLLPMGAVGEIVAEGPTVGRGYLNDAKRSAASFIPSPAWLRSLRGESAGSDSRLYKTGDMGQYQPDGSISFLGRRDGQVKIRGQRVELSEVEHHVSRQFEGSPEVIALVIEHGQRQKLVAFVAWLDRETGTNGNAAKDPDIILGNGVSKRFRELLPAVRTRLDHALPPYMVPTVFLPLASVPLTKSGKADRRLLLQLVSRLTEKELEAFGEGEKPHRDPASRAEHVFQRLFARTLGLDPRNVSADDHFFKIGGDSITAMRLVGEARRDGISINVSQIFLNPVLSVLATVEKSLDSVSRGSSIYSYSAGSLLNIVDVAGFASSLANLPPPFEPKDIQDVLPATAFQTNCLTGGHILYHWLQLPESVDLSRLEDTCHALIQHHAIFRTLFITHGSQHLQVILRSPHCSIIHMTCDDDIHSFTESMCLQDSTSVKTLGHPLFQTFLISRRGSNDHRLVLRLSHAQYDGTSMGQALKDLSIAYDGGRLPPSVPSFAQYLHYKRATQSSETGRFWQSFLRGARMTDLDTFACRNSQGSVNPDGQTVTAQREIPLPSQHDGIPVAFLAQATWALMLAQITGERDIVFGFVSQSRNAPVPHMDQISGPCSNILPTRITVDPAWTVGQLMSHVKDQYVRMVPHATLDLKEIQPLIPAWPPSTRFGSVFNHVNMSILSAPRLGGIECEQGVVSPGGAAKFLRGYSKFLVRTTLWNGKLGIYMSGWEEWSSSQLLHDLVDRFVTTITEFSSDYSRPLTL